MQVSSLNQLKLILGGFITLRGAGKGLGFWINTGAFERSDEQLDFGSRLVHREAGHS
jgi:hypothetical protein